MAMVGLVGLVGLCRFFFLYLYCNFYFLLLLFEFSFVILHSKFSCFFYFILPFTTVTGASMGTPIIGEIEPCCDISHWQRSSGSAKPQQLCHDRGHPSIM